MSNKEQWGSPQEAYENYLDDISLWEIKNYYDDGWHKAQIEWDFHTFRQDFKEDLIRLKERRV